MENSYEKYPIPNKKQPKSEIVEQAPLEGEEALSLSGVVEVERQGQISAAKQEQSDLEQIQLQREKLGLKPEKKKISEISKANIDRLKKGFIRSVIEKGLFPSEEEALQAIEHEKEAVKTNMALTVNLTAESVERLLQQGRQETLWDHLREAGDIEEVKKSGTIQKKDLHDEYLSYRGTAETALREYVPDDFSEYKPVYAALAGGTTHDLECGACLNYGNYFLELDNLEFGKSVLNFNDSFANVDVTPDGHYEFKDSSLLSLDDAEEAKALVNLLKEYNSQFPTVGGMIEVENVDKLLKIDGKTSGYVEAAVFDEITMDKIKSIGIYIGNRRDLKGIGTLIKNYPQFGEKGKFILRGEEVGGLTKEWLSNTFGDRVFIIEEEENPKSSLWEQLGLDPHSSYEEVKNALDKRCDELWKQLRFRIGEDFHSKPGHNQVARIRKNMWKFGDPIVKEAAELYMQLENERLFFE